MKSDVSWRRYFQGNLFVERKQGRGIQTRAKSFQKLVRIVKKKKTQKTMPESLNREMPIRPRCLITEFVNSNCTTFVVSFQRTSALNFTEGSPHPFPLPLPLLESLLNICALVQICYCFFCTSENSLLLAEHNCAAVKVSSHWLL